MMFKHISHIFVCDELGTFYMCIFFPRNWFKRAAEAARDEDLGNCELRLEFHTTKDRTGQSPARLGADRSDVAISARTSAYWVAFGCDQRKGSCAQSVQEIYVGADSGGHGG